MTTTFTIPTIETERLILRAWREEDLGALSEFWTDEENTRFLGGPRDQARVWTSMLVSNGAWSVQGFGFMAVALRETGELVGSSGPLYPFGWPEPEVGWSIFPAHQRKGFASEAGKAALTFAYKNLGWTTAVSLIEEGNIASERVATKLGGQCDQENVQVTDFTCNIWRHLPPKQFFEKFGGSER